MWYNIDITQTQHNNCMGCGASGTERQHWHGPGNCCKSFWSCSCPHCTAGSSGPMLHRWGTGSKSYGHASWHDTFIGHMDMSLSYVTLTCHTCPFAEWDAACQAGANVYMDIGCCWMLLDVVGCCWMLLDVRYMYPILLARSGAQCDVLQVPT